MTGGELRNYRLVLRKSQLELGSSIGMSRTMVGYMERGVDGEGNPVVIGPRTELAVWCLLYEAGAHTVGERVKHDSLS